MGSLDCSCLSTAGVSRLKASRNISALHQSEKVYTLKKLMYVVEFPPRALVSIFTSSNNIQECLFLQILSHFRHYFIK